MLLLPGGASGQVPSYRTQGVKQLSLHPSLHQKQVHVHLETRRHWLSYYTAQWKDAQRFLGATFA